MANRERDRGVTIRLTEREKAFYLLQYEKSHLPTQADFLMALLKAKPIVVVEELRGMTAELRKQGTNLNQIARYLNAGGDVDVELLATISDYRNFYQKLRILEVK